MHAARKRKETKRGGEQSPGPPRRAPSAPHPATRPHRGLGGLGRIPGAGRGAGEAPNPATTALSPNPTQPRPLPFPSLLPFHLHPSPRPDPSRSLPAAPSSASPTSSTNGGGSIARLERHHRLLLRDSRRPPPRPARTAQQVKRPSLPAGPARPRGVASCPFALPPLWGLRLLCTRRGRCERPARPRVPPQQSGVARCGCTVTILALGAAVPFVGRVSSAGPRAPRPSRALLRLAIVMYTRVCYVNQSVPTEGPAMEVCLS